MDIAELQAFVAVAENQSFSVAADKVFITQPAISKRIAGLEAELGTTLFDRIGRKIQLTEAGTSLLPRARTILAELAAARTQVANLSGEISGLLTMATSHHIGLHRLAPALARFHQEHADAELDIRFMDSESACHAVEDGRVELAVVTLPTRKSTKLETVVVWHDPLEIVVSPDHPLADSRRVSLQKLVSYPAILPGPGTFTRELVLSALAGQRNNVNIAMATNYLEVLKMLATIGLGWTALPHTMIDDGLFVVHAEGMEIKRQLGIVTHRAHTLSNAARAMIETITTGADK